MNRKGVIKKKERIEEIMTAAKTIFSKKGYFGSTIDEIAKVAGISKGTIYLYFKNKDDLYISLMMPLLEEFERVLIDFKNDFANNQYKTRDEVIQGFCEMFIKQYRYDAEALRILQIYQLLNLHSVIKEETRERLWLIGKKSRIISEDIIYDSIKLGLLPKVNPVQLIDVLMGTFLGIVQMEENKSRISGKNHIVETLKYCFSLISNGLCRSTS